MLAYDPNDGHYLNGNIYSVRIYDRGLTENEIANNYNYDINEFNIKWYLFKNNVSIKLIFQQYNN